MSTLMNEFIEFYDKQITEVLESATSRQIEQMHTESALCKLLRRYSDELPDISDERFHRSFRQIDCVDRHAPDGKGGLMDMVFWNLLYPCNLFWKSRDAFLQKGGEPEDDGST